MQNDTDRYYELDNLINTIELLIEDCISKGIKDDLLKFKEKYLDERNELENRIANFRKEKR